MRRLVLLLSVVLAAGVFAAAVLADDQPPPTTTTTATTPTVVPDGVVLAGVPIGGLDPATASAAVQASFERPVTMRFESTTISVSPDLLGLTVAVDPAVAKALTVVPGTSLTLRGSMSLPAARAIVAKVANRFDREPVSSRLLLRNFRPLVTPAVVGRVLEGAPAVAAIRDQVVHGTRAPIVLRAKLTQPETTPKTIGPVIVIRRSSNVLTLYDGMKVERLFHVATGQSVYPTPLGRFQIVVMWRNPWWYPPASPWAAGEKPVPPGPGNPLGTRWMGLSTPGVGIHGTPDDASIGYSVSHGCIRMHIPEAEWLFNHVEVGTPVFIVSA